MRVATALPFVLTLACAGSAAAPAPAPAPTAEPAPAPAPAPEPAPRPAPPTRPDPEAAAPARGDPLPTDPLGAEAAAVVDRQLRAYNAQDTEAFLATYGDSVRVQKLGDTLVVRGKAALRESTEAWFTRAPEARSEVVHRMVLGPYVVDRQRLTGTPDGTVEAIGIYEVREGLIRQVWSIPPPPTPR